MNPKQVKKILLQFFCRLSPFSKTRSLSWYYFELTEVLKFCGEPTLMEEGKKEKRERKTE